MRTKVTLVLLLLNVVLFYYISHFEFGKKDPQLGKSVYGSEVAAIESFARKDRSGFSLMMEKRGANWWLTKPYEWPANPNAISGIISELQHLNHETSFAVQDLAKNGQTLSDYGLADPALTFTFVAGGKSYETKVGDSTKVGNRLYLLSPNGTRIHVVGSSLLDKLGLSLDRLRSENIFSIPVFEVRSLSLQTTANQTTAKVRLRRDGERWSFETPILTRANKGAVVLAINGLNALQTQKFLEPREAADSALTGLASPAIRVTLEGNARRETLLLGRAVTTSEPAARTENEPAVRPTVYYAKFEDKPTVFTTAIPAALLESLTAAQEKLRDAHILEFDPRTVTAITLTAPGQPELNLHRLEAASGTPTWQLINRNGAGQAPQTLPADGALVAELLQKLELFSATKFISDTPSAADRENFGFNRPEREITLNLSTGGGPHLTDASTLILQIGVKPEERSIAYAMLSNTTFVYQVDRSILDSTPVDTRQFRQRMLRELPEGARITALTLTETGNTTPLYSHQLAEGESWEKALLTEPEARQKALIAILVQLRALRAQRFITETFDADHAELNGTSQPWKYQLTATLALTGGNGTTQTNSSTLVLTDRIDSTTQLAGSAEFNVTFAVTQEMLDALFTLTYAAKHDPGAAPKPEQPAAK